MSVNERSTILLIGSAMLIPALVYAGRFGSALTRTALQRSALRAWLVLLITVLVVRALMGVLLASIGGTAHLWAVNEFWPFRIAYPNYGILAGLPFGAVLLVGAIYVDKIYGFVSSRRARFFLLWTVAFVFSVSFGAVHGGLIDGNLGVAVGADHLRDAAINPTLTALFKTHTARILGELLPSYEAPHSVSHPAGAIAYWQAVARGLPPLAFSLLNAAIFSLTFSIINSAIWRQSSPGSVHPATFVTMFAPAMLIYGRSDDAVYYFLALLSVALTAVAFQARKYALSGIAGGVAGIAANFSYASVTLLPSMVTLTVDETIGDLRRYVRHTWIHAAIVGVVICAFLTIEWRALGFNYLSGFLASARRANDLTLAAILASGQIVRAFDDRAMTILDFVLLGGPAFVVVYIAVFRGFLSPPRDWPIRNVALVILFAAIVIEMASAGETARDWGSLFPIMGLCLLPSALSGATESDWVWMMRAQLIWALLLQVPINFGW